MIGRHCRAVCGCQLRRLAIDDASPFHFNTTYERQKLTVHAVLSPANIENVNLGFIVKAKIRLQNVIKDCIEKAVCPPGINARVLRQNESTRDAEGEGQILRRMTIAF